MDMSAPAISVLMAVYNGGHFLRKSIESVLTQTFGDFEFVIVDDCSTDDTVSTIRSYHDERIVLYENMTNQGQTKSLNIGLKKARGRYIARIDADDMVLPDWLEKVYDFAEKNKDYSVVSCQSMIVDQNGRVTSATKAPASYPEVLLKNIMESAINHVGSLMLKEHITEADGYDDNYKIVADYDLWTRLLIKKHRLVNINAILTVTMVHNISATMRGKSRRDAEIIDVMQKNVANFTSSVLTKDELRVLWRILHDIKNCGDEASNADRLIDNIYDAVKPDLGLSNSLVQKIKENKKQEIFKKRIFMLIKNRKCVGAREVLKKYTQTKGWFNFFGLVYFLSFFSMFTENIETIYNVILSFATKMRLGRAVKRLAS